MDYPLVTLRLPQALLDRAQTVAQRQDVTIGHLVRTLLRREVDRQLSAKTTERADERLVAALQALLASEIALAESWTDLAERLAAQGYELRPAGGGLTLHKRPEGTRLCKASELGFAYRKLVKRFRSGMPGHPHGALGLQFDPPLARATRLARSPDDDFDVIEYDA